MAEAADRIDAADAPIERARLLESQGHLDRACIALDEAIALGPPHVDMLIWKGQMLHKLARPLDAVEAFSRAVEIDPNHATPHFGLALVYEDLGIWEKGLRQWEDLIDLIPENGQPYFQAGVIFGLHLLQFDRAFRLFNCLPKVIDGFWLKLIKDVQRERDAARERVHATLRARKRGGSVDVQLVSDLLHLGRIRMAQALLAEIGPNLDRDVRMMAQFEITWRIDEVENALTEAGREVDLSDPPPLMRFMLSDALYQIGEFEKSAQIWRRLPVGDLSPHHQEIFWRASFATRNFAEARSLGESVMALRPYDTKGAQYVLSTLLAEGTLTPTNGPAAATESGEMLIPPVLFRFWDKPRPPADVQAVMDSWNAPEVGLNQILFDEPKARRFILETYSERYLAAFDACHHPAMKSDFLRLCYLTKVGGVYLDVDQVRVPDGPSLRRSLSGRSLVLPLSATGPVYTNNNIIAAVPGHPVLRLALAEALLLIEEAVRSGERPNLWVTTGPGVFTRSLVRFLLARLNGDADAAAGGEIALFSDRYLGSMTALVNDLAYKSSAEGNWRLI